jgi:hypothetical protein
MCISFATHVAHGSIIIRYDSMSVGLYTKALNAWVASFGVKDASCPKGRWKVESNWTTMNHHDIEVEVCGKHARLDGVLKPLH